MHYELCLHTVYVPKNLKQLIKKRVYHIPLFRIILWLITLGKIYVYVETGILLSLSEGCLNSSQDWELPVLDHAWDTLSPAEAKGQLRQE